MRCRNDWKFHVGGLSRDEAAIAHKSEPDANVNPFFNRIADAIGQTDIQCDRGMTRGDALQ
jgi:hypothetical protein